MKHVSLVDHLEGLSKFIERHVSDESPLQAIYLKIKIRSKLRDTCIIILKIVLLITSQTVWRL